MDRSLVIDTEKMDKKDVIIVKMGIAIIGLVGALIFSLYSNINLSATIVEPLHIVWQLIIVFVAFLCAYITWHFTLGSEIK